MVSDDRVAKLETTIDLTKGEANVGDAAIASILPDNYEGNRIPAGCNFPDEGKRIRRAHEFMPGSRRKCLK
jgi:hypothetical protein